MKPGHTPKPSQTPAHGNEPAPGGGPVPTAASAAGMDAPLLPDTATPEGQGLERVKDYPTLWAGCKPLAESICAVFELAPELIEIRLALDPDPGLEGSTVLIPTVEYAIYEDIGDGEALDEDYPSEYRDLRDWETVGLTNADEDEGGRADLSAIADTIEERLGAIAGLYSHSEEWYFRKADLPDLGQDDPSGLFGAEADDLFEEGPGQSRDFEIFLPNGFTDDTLPSIGSRITRFGAESGASFFVGTMAECEAKLEEMKANPNPAAWNAFLEASGVLGVPYVDPMRVQAALAVITAVRQGLNEPLVSLSLPDLGDEDDMDVLVLEALQASGRIPKVVDCEGDPEDPRRDYHVTWSSKNDCEVFRSGASGTVPETGEVVNENERLLRVSVTLLPRP